MKILVAVKRVVDYNVKISVKPGQTSVDTSNLKMSMNPFCEIAVEEAIRQKEKGIADEIVVVSIGSQACQEQLRSALALGADRAILVEAEDNLESLAVAKLLAAVMKAERPDLVILGKQSIDSDANQTGQMLAALTDLPQGTFASAIDINEGSVEVTREVDSGLQTLSLTLPAIVTTDLRLNEPRYASLPNIMKAKRKPLDVIPAADYDIDTRARLQTLAVEAPSQRQSGVRVSSVDELLNKLKHEAKVI
ncbi:electron transfer flavoprotein subunit beta/FixA family protein [Klebsiella variicola]|uniref:electron transfer flavoprotein subunit beta/FixA family protein n=1 Tax=Klebsiella variicola TaxID=244366 RepID=UPI0023A92649|nr:electron transfer flavoprotein subunit beta/FixA family protein [Klebsiella variicola]MDD9601309.1 electron transfer flavoprotein subunit beta/FixA family protein [Klebsiella variicola]